MVATHPLEPIYHGVPMQKIEIILTIKPIKIFNVIDDFPFKHQTNGP